MIEQPRHVLVCPLDWGLGHAARCVPVIRCFLEEGFKVTIAGHGRSLAMLRHEFPETKTVGLPGFSPSYPISGNMVTKMALLAPAFLKSIYFEHRLLNKIIENQHVDIVISDNRYGVWNKKTRNIIITHQLMIKTPAWLASAEKLLYHISRLLISKFDGCWIPDLVKAPGLSGDLSHKFPLPANARFVGILTRFDHTKANQPPQKKEGLLAIISGPEPQRSLFEEILIRQLTKLNLPATFICGRPELKTISNIGKITLLPHLSATETEALIRRSELVICRSGYSSIMDLAAIGAKTLFVPTPGQTEQIYLAKLHHQSGTTLFREQHRLDLSVDLAEALNYKGFQALPENLALAETIKNLKQK